MSVNIRAQFGKKQRQRNGLENIAEDLVAKPEQPVYVVAKVVVAKTEINHLDGDSEVSKVTFTHIEPMLSQQDEDKIRKILETAYKRRTGQSIDTPLPNMPGEEPLPEGDGDSDD